MPDGDSFLPRIQSVFYSVFDVRQGPKIVYQVPEGLIAVPSSLSATSSVPPTPATDTAAPTPTPSRTSSASLVSHFDPSRSPHKRSSSANHTLFNFDDISKYIIPPSALCGRLVICATKRHRVIGFPVELMGKYKRNYFRYNLCFVFERTADLSCYEPIVRKVSRILSSCEIESGLLSSPQTSPTLHAILEQLYEDLNSYSETSIPVDQFNSIELKIFPFYPNPPEVQDWMVPLALINLTKRIQDNWDLTMAKICKFIDGTNHVSRIAHLANCDISLARQAISHLLYYQVIMTIDIFQYSNMYTLRKSMQWLADESHVKDECGPYVTKPGKPIPDWPKLLHLYSRLKPGKSIFEWMETYDVHQLGIDIRRFTSFGVIKGFLRRVHRWPILLPSDPSQPQSSVFEPVSLSRKRDQSLVRGRSPQIAPPIASLSPDIAAGIPAVIQDPQVPISSTHRARRASAAEKVLEQLRTRDLHKAGATIQLTATPRTSWIHYQKENSPSTTGNPTAAAPATDAQVKPISGLSGTRRHSITSPGNPISSSSVTKAILTPLRPRPSRTPSTTDVMMSAMSSGLQNPPFPPELLLLLDGEHHTDDLAVRFQAGWPLLERWLVAAGDGKGDGDFGRVSIIYR